MRSERGFTLIELLVVVGIIGILAAIALPAFLGQTKKGEDSAAKSHISLAVKAIEEFAVENGTYDTDTATLQASHPALDDAVGLTVAGDGSTYAVTVESLSGTTFAARRNGGGVVHDCSHPGEGGCASTPDASGNYW